MTKEPADAPAFPTGTEGSGTPQVTAPANAIRCTDTVSGQREAYERELLARDHALRETSKALRKSLDRYQDLYDAAPVGFFALTFDGVIGEINAAGASLLGADRERLLGQSFGDFIAPEHRGNWQELFDGAVQQHRMEARETTVRRVDGAFFHGQIDGVHLFQDGGGQVVRFALSDITKRYKAQASEHRLRDILDSTLDMIFIFSPDTLCIEYANKGAVSAIGHSREELLNMTALDLLPLIPEPECRAFISPLVSNKRKMRRFETYVRRKEGASFPIEAQLQFVRDDEGQATFVAIARSITKRKLAEKELRRQKKLLRQVIDTDPNMIFVKDSEGKFILANQAIADHYSLSVRDMIGKRDSEINMNPTEVEGFRRTDEEVIKTRREIVLTESIMKNGMQRWSQTFKRPLVQDDGSVNVLGIGVDVTDLKISRDRLAESYRELQRLSLHLENIRADERVQIGRDLHDEMGATLAALKMQISWLKSKLPAGSQQLTLEFDRISDLVSDAIRTMRRVVTELRPNLLDDVGLAAAVSDYVKKFQKDTNIQCQLFLPAEMRLNEDQSITFFRIVQESLSNVAKHAGASKVEITFSHLGERLQLDITDDGVGFDSGHKERSFGLLGIKERALMIGGAATIVSAVGRGTCVSVSIPVSEPASA